MFFQELVHSQSRTTYSRTWCVFVRSSNIKCFHFSNHSGRTFLSRFYPHFTTNSLNVIHFPFCHKRQRAIFLNARLFARGYRFLCLPFLPWLCFLQSDRPNSYHGREEQSLLIWMLDGSANIFQSISNL